MSLAKQKWMCIGLGVAVLIAAHALWDYVEARRLRAYVAAVRASGAPVTLFDAVPRYPNQWPTAENNAAPFYSAAAVLARGAENREVPRDRAESNPHARFHEAAGKASPVPTELLAQVGGILRLRSSAEALRLLDTATTLEFKGFAPGAPEYQMQLLGLLRLCGLRTEYFAVTGDAAGAAASALASIRIFGGHDRPLGFAVDELWFSEGPFQSSVAQIELLLNRTSPSEASLAPLADALADADEDDRLVRLLNDSRAELLEFYLGGNNPANGYGAYGLGGLISPGVLTRRSWGGIITRPFSSHQLNGELEAYAQLVQAGSEPWPARVNHAKAIQQAIKAKIFDRFVAGMRVDLLGVSTARIRAARTAVALERYKRAHANKLPAALADLVPALLASLPIDPFSGDSLKYRAVDTGGYVVYSIGQNATDDNGAIEVVDPSSSGQRRPDPRDVGVRVTRK